MARLILVTKFFGMTHLHIHIYCKLILYLKYIIVKFLKSAYFSWLLLFATHLQMYVLQRTNIRSMWLWPHFVNNTSLPGPILQYFKKYIYIYIRNLFALRSRPQPFKKDCPAFYGLTITKKHHMIDSYQLALPPFWSFVLRVHKDDFIILAFFFVSPSPPPHMKKLKKTRSSFSFKYFFSIYFTILTLQLFRFHVTVFHMLLNRDCTFLSLYFWLSYTHFVAQLAVT